jgi:hypothetical protein
MKIVNDVIYAGTTGGLFKSTDKGMLWIEINRGFEASQINSIEVKGNSIILATSDGIECSTDGGLSWYRANKGLNFFGINCLIIYNSKIWIGTEQGGVYESEFLIDDVAETAPEINDISLFPNPADNFLKVKLPDDSEDLVDIRIINIIGEEIIRYEGINGMILSADGLDISSLSSGMYNIIISSGKGYQSSLKFIKY